MSTVNDNLAERFNLDTRTVGNTADGLAKRRAKVAQYRGPAHRLDALGVDVPREFHPEDAHEYPTTKVCESGDNTVRVHLHQDVKEAHDDEFGAIDAFGDVDDVIWTVVDLIETVDLTVVGDWGKRRSVPFDEFAENYEPLYLADGQPAWGY